MPIGVFVFEKSLRSEGPKRNDHFWLDQLELANEIGTAGFDLIRQRISVAGRPMLEDVADEYLFAREVDRRENLGEQLARLPDERPTRLVFLRARSLADANELGLRIAFAGNRIRRRLVERAARAFWNLLRDFFERIQLLDRAGNQLPFSRSYDDPFLNAMSLGFRTGGSAAACSASRR